MEIDQQLEQRINIKFLMKLGKNGPEIHQMLQQVYGECALKERTVFKWVQRFRKGREDPKDDARSGRPCTSSGNENINLVRSLVLSERRLTIGMIAEELCLGKSSVYTILTEHLDMKKVCAKIVPKLLTPEQKLQRKECCADWENLRGK
jgi:transposase